MTSAALQPGYAGSKDLHIAIIMDGNGRWARKRGLPRTMGHRKGAEALKKLLSDSRQLPIKYMTLYAFSSENWNRPDTEVNDLMGLLSYYLEKELELLDKEGIRLRVIGDLSLCDPKLAKLICNAVERTKENQTLNLTIALSYGAQQELATATRTIAQEVEQGTLRPEDITEETITSKLYTADLPAPDLLIRTGGEKRLSNFLLWQSAYTELFFTDIFWPDFSSKDLRHAIEEFQLRERRYGGV